MRILRRWRSEVKANALPYSITAALIGLAFLCGIRTGQAQNLCTNPLFPGDFSLSKDKICVGSPITITGVPSTIINAKYSFQYDGKSSLSQIASSLSASTTFTYSQPGSYTILQAGSGNGTGSGTLLCKVVTVLPLDPVKFVANPCSGRRATLTVDVTTLGQFDTYLIHWGDGIVDEKSRSEMQNNPSHTYNSSSTNTPSIVIDGVYGTATSPLCKAISSQTVTLSTAATQPVITTLRTTDDKTITLTYQAGTGASVQLYQKVNGAYSPTGQNGTGSGSFTVQTDAKQTQCFQVVTQDVCNSSGLRSDEVCSLVLDVKAVNKQNNLSWQAYAGTVTQFRYYRIFRNGGVNGQVSNQSTTSYADANNIMCGVQYCYSLEAQPGPNTTVSSSTVCVTGISSDVPGTLGSTVVSIENNQPRLVSTLPTTNVTSSYTLVVSRSNGAGGPFEPIGTSVNKNTYVDQTANASTGSYCYQVAYQSGCGLMSAPSEPVCTVFLSSKSANGIDWTAESPFKPDKTDNYIIEVIDSVNNTRQEITNIGLNTHYDLSSLNLDVQAQKYRIIAVSEYGTISYSNFFVFRREVKILVPDAFTPGNDGMNETFVAKGIYFDQFRMTIYDRWGEPIFTSTSKNNGWDGRINGQEAQPGQYMYRIEVTDLTGFKTVRTGALLLVR